MGEGPAPNKQKKDNSRKGPQRQDRGASGGGGIIWSPVATCDGCRCLSLPLASLAVPSYSLVAALQARQRVGMVKHDAPKTFSVVAKLLREHIKDAEHRCSAFEHQCDAPEFLASMRGEHREAAARWWWREVID